MNRYKKRVALNPEAAPYIAEVDLGRARDETRRNVAVTLSDTVDFSAIFGNPNPVEMEIGFGTGRFLIEYSRANPGTNLFGVEITKKMVYLAANRLHEEKIPNARIIHADAILFLKSRAPDACAQRVHVYFPDPWVKKRHLKRRLVNREFLKETFRVLVPGGRLNFFTDHEPYFYYFLEEKAAFPGFIDDEGAVGGYVPTAYEEKWVKQGKKIFRTVLRKP